MFFSSSFFAIPRHRLRFCPPILLPRHRWTPPASAHTTLSVPKDDVDSGDAKSFAFMLKQIKLGHEPQNSLGRGDAAMSVGFVNQVLLHVEDLHLALDFVAWAESEKGCLPDLVTCRSLISICGDVGSWMHHWKQKGYKLPENSLLDLICWYCQHKDLAAALKIYSALKSHGLSLNSFTCNCLINSSLQEEDHPTAIAIFQYMLGSVSSPPNTYTFRSLVQGLTKAGRVDLASVYFKQMLEMGFHPNATTWNCMISGFLKVGRVDAAMQAFDHMKIVGCRPDEITYRALVKYLCKAKQIFKAYCVFGEMLSVGMAPNLLTYNILLDGLGREGQFEKALDLFKDMEIRGCSPDVVTYSTLVNILCKGGQAQEAYILLDHMKKQACMADCIVYNTLIDGFGKCGDMQRAWELFEMMKSDGCSPNSVTFTTLINLLLEAGRTTEAEALFEEMKIGCVANAVTYRVLVEGFGKLEETTRAWKIFEEMNAKGFSPTVSTYGILVVALGKAGEVEKACQLFQGSESILFSPKLDLYKTFLLALYEGSFKNRIMDFLQIRLPQMKANELGVFKTLGDYFLKTGQVDIASKIFESLRACGVDSEAAVIENSDVFSLLEKGQIHTSV